MAIKTNELQQMTSFEESDSILMDTAAGTKRMPMKILIPNTPAAHNSAPRRGKVLTDEYTLGEIFAMVAARDYHDIFAGDIIKADVPAIAAITQNSVELYTGFAGGKTEFLVGEIESHHSFGDSVPLAGTGHLMLIPKGTLGSGKMNPTNTTEGGYAGSKMHTVILPAVLAALESAFGTDHIKTTREWLGNAVNTTTAAGNGMGWTGATSAGTWGDCRIRLMTELEAYGADPWSSSAHDSIGLAKQIAVFRQDREALSIRAHWWLSAVASSTNFCHVSSSGHPGHSDASSSLVVRPRFIIG